MDSSGFCVYVFCFLLLGVSSAKEFAPRKGGTEFESDGGKMEVWSGFNLGAFRDANVAACKTTLKNRGLWLPSYVDSPCIHIVTRGSGTVGIIPPVDGSFHENTFEVREGDVIAIPEGVTSWWYNDDEDQHMEIVGVARVEKNGLMAFHLAGGKEDRDREHSGYSSVLHGFSINVLARAWDMSEQVVRRILQEQKGMGIIKVDEKIRFPISRSNRHPEFVYHLLHSYPDVRVSNGGELRELNSFKLPVLEKLGMGVECMQLKQEAMVAPNWFNAHQVIFVLEGSGIIQVVDNNGNRVLDEKVENGSVIIVPAYYASTKIAGNRGLHYMSVVTSDRPTISYLSGRNAIYARIPLKALAKMLNVSEEVAKEVQRGHERHSIILPQEQHSSF